MSDTIKVIVYDAKSYDIESFEGAEHEEIEFKFVDAKLNEFTVSLCENYDAVCAFVNDTLNEKVILEMDRLGVKMIAMRCAGYNNVDLSTAFGRIHVMRVPAYSPYAVAEHAIAMLLTSIRRIHKAYLRTRDFNFSIVGLEGFDLHGKTVGVVGTGRIGRCFIDICKGFGMNVLTYDKYPVEISGTTQTTLNDLFAKSDIISLHCPLMEETYHMVNKDSIARMKKGVVIINTSRGGLVDSEELYKGLRARKIGAACLDVYDEEGDIFFEDRSGHILNDETLSLLISMPNVLVTSHQAFLTSEALDNIADTTIKNIRDFIHEGKSDNEVCYRCSKFGTCNTTGKCF